ncbi:MAG: carbohydrate kinase [Gemmatimonadota bacterium]|nr:carbohydrate kinase [Gemmatimonadota bacterium]
MRKTIVAIGEALWDVFPDRRRPGGAPCNVAFHAAQLGNRSAIVTRVGVDAAGDDLVAFLRARGVDTGLVQRDAARPTGTVAVTLAGGEPRYTITEGVAWDYLAPDEAARALVRTADAVCVGSLAQRSAASRATIRQLLEAAKGQALVVFDANLRLPFVDSNVIAATCRRADVVKLSEEEVDRLAALLARPAPLEWLLGEAGVTAVCVTRGKDGASLTTRQGTVSAPGVDLDTSAGDAVGAGDAFTAALVHRLVRNATREDALQTANRYAALVASRQGAMPELSAEDLAGTGLAD